MADHPLDAALGGDVVAGERARRPRRRGPARPRRRPSSSSGTATPCRPSGAPRATAWRRSWRLSPGPDWSKTGPRRKAPGTGGRSCTPCGAESARFSGRAASGAQPAPPPEGSQPADDARWSMPMEELATQVPASDDPPPDAHEARRRIYRRSHALRVLVRRRANGRCEGCEREAPFLDRQGRPHLEPHHTTRVADGGPDAPEHVIALCPDCHRRVHSGQDGDQYNEGLRARLAAIVSAAAG